MALENPTFFGILTENTVPVTVPNGGAWQLIDAPGDQTINVASGGSLEVGSSGSNTINVQANAAEFTVSLDDDFGVVLTGSNGESITVGTPSTPQSVVFGDGATTLSVDGDANDGAGAVLMGGQEVTDVDTAVDVATAITDTNTTSGDVFGSDTGPGGGNNGGGGDTQAPTVDAGQTLTFTENAAEGDVLGTVTADDDTGVTGFSIVDDGQAGGPDDYVDIAADGTGTGTATVTLNADGAADDEFNDFETTPNSFSFDVEAVDAAGNTSAAQSVAINVENDPADDPMGGGLTDVDLDALGGTVQAPASEDADGGAFNFTDDRAAQSFTDITNFGADDELTLTGGVTAEDLENGISSSTDDSGTDITEIQFTDGGGTISQITLVGVEGFFFNVDSFNSDPDLGNITFA